MKKQLKADMALIFVTICWGISYLMMDISLSDLEPFTLNAFRFLGAFFIAAVIAFPRVRKVNFLTVKYSIIIGVILVAVYAGATFGVMFTSLSNAGFLCAMTCVFTPVFGYFFKGQRPDRKFIAVIVLCFIGIALLSLNEELKPASGDILCMICALAYAADLLVTESAVTLKDVDPVNLGIWQLGFTGLFNLILAIAAESPHLPQSPKVWLSSLFLAVFCTGLAFIVQSVAQQFTSASRVGIIFTLEPVFSAIAAYFIAGEVLLPRGYLGAFLMLAALLLMEVDIGGVAKKITAGRL